MTYSDLKEALKTALNVPVYDDGGSITYPSATIDILSNTPGLVGDGRAVSRTKSVKIDLWYLDASTRDTAEATVLALLESISGITSPDIVSTFDTQARKYRATFNFEIV